MSKVTLTPPLLAPRPIFCSLGSSPILWLSFKVYVVQLLSCVLQFVNPWTAACWSSLSFTVSWSLLRPMSIESVMPSNHLILCHPLLLLPSIFPSIRVFSNELVLHIRWPKYWSFSFSISPSNECSALICFRMDWFEWSGCSKVKSKSPTTTRSSKE